jgi:hypothetical protein
MSDTPSPDATSPTLPALAEVRYSLPQLLKELEIERASDTFAMAKLDQTEIGKLFKNRTPARRVKPKK